MTGVNTVSLVHTAHGKISHKIFNYKILSFKIPKLQNIQVTKSPGYEIPNLKNSTEHRGLFPRFLVSRDAVVTQFSNWCLQNRPKNRRSNMPGEVNKFA
jgi:hypothetical protein